MLTKAPLLPKKVHRDIAEPTEWVNSITIVGKKNESLRICPDPRDLNKGLTRKHCCRTIEDVVARLHICGDRRNKWLDAITNHRRQD